MEENEEVKQQEEITKEAKETFKQAKEQMKDINFKEEAKKGKGLLGKLFKDPIGAIKEIVNDKENSVFKTAILIVALWVIIVGVKYIINCIAYKYTSFKILTFIKIILAPIAKILVPAVIIYMLNKEKKTTLSKVISLVSVVKIPLVISALLGYLTIINSAMSYITSPLSALLYVLSIILMFFAVKEIFEEQEDEKAIKTFTKVIGIYYICYFVLSFIGISL